MAPKRLQLNNRPKKFDFYKEFGIFFESIVTKINTYRLKEQEKNELYDILGDLVDQNIKLIKSQAQLNNTSTDECLNSTREYIIGEIRKQNTTYKRKKAYEQSEKYVQPEEKAIGMKWQTTYDHVSCVPQHELKQATFQYIPIVKTLTNLFSDEQFKTLYESNEHVCTPNIYQNYCCAENFQKSDLFKENPDALQLLLYTDDFQMTDPLKTKSKNYKMCAVYLQVVNMPRKFLSKLDNIYLVALCETENMKQEYTDIDNILELVVNEIKSLEKIGIDIGKRERLKGGLVSFAFDNLGGNDVCGFKKSFSSDFFCRHCECTTEESRKWTKENVSSFRTIENYTKQVEASQMGDKVDYQRSKGVRKPCLLNDLCHFHILKNRYCDLMHDVNEGVIPFALHHLFTYCIDKKILSKKKLQDNIRDFNYGILNTQKKPSILDLNSRHLGQNATQSFCLITHIPFILYQYQTQLESIWVCIESLLDIIQILYSEKVSDDDINNLEILIDLHLSTLIEKFGVTLLPKQHFLTHYPKIMRENGPVLNNWCMRMEAKHRFFTKIAESNKNFVNIAKTLATAHQKHILDAGFTYTDSFESSKRRSNMNMDIWQNIDTTNINFADTFSIDFFSCNNIEYRIGLIVIMECIFYEIYYIFSDTHDYWLVCIPLEVNAVNRFLHSYELKPKPETVSNAFRLIKQNDLENKKTFEKKCLNQSTYIQMVSMDMKGIIVR